MFYQRSLQIEKRLQEVLRLIRSGDYSTPTIADQLGVSIPTVSRDVTALRERGHSIHANRQPDGSWKYSLVRSPPRNGRTKNEDLAEARP